MHVRLLITYCLLPVTDFINDSSSLYIPICRNSTDTFPYTSQAPDSSFQPPAKYQSFSPWLLCCFAPLLAIHAAAVNVSSAENVWSEVVTGPGLPSLASLGLTSAELSEEGLSSPQLHCTYLCIDMAPAKTFGQVVQGHPFRR